LLVGDLVCRGHAVSGLASNGVGQCGVLFRSDPVPSRLANFGGQLVDRVNGDLHLLVAVHDGAQHDFLGQAVSFGLNHQDRVFGAGNDEFEVRALKCSVTRVQQVFAITVANFGCANRTCERHAGDGECRGRANQRRDVGINVRVQRHNGRDDLYFVGESFRKQRTYRPIDQTTDENLFLGRTTFAFEEATWDLARCVSLLLVVNGQREKVPTRLRSLAAYSRNHYLGIGHIDHDCTICLAS